MEKIQCFLFLHGFTRVLLIKTQEHCFYDVFTLNAAWFSVFFPAFTAWRYISAHGLYWCGRVLSLNQRDREAFLSKEKRRLGGAIRIFQAFVGVYGFYKLLVTVAFFLIFYGFKQVF